MDTNNEIFPGKKLSDLFQEIHKNSRETKNEVRKLVKDLVADLKDSDRRLNLVDIVPLIQGYLEIGVRNDEHLIKLAGVIQKLEKDKVDPKEFDFSDIEKLLDEVEKTNSELKTVKKSEDE